jgi:hypothetical protein
MNIFVVAFLASAVPQVVALKWHTFESKQYTLIDTLKSWSTQKTVCESVGASLVSIHSAAENKFVLSLMPDAPKHRWAWLWIGMSPDSSGKLNSPTHWEDGTSIDYTNWASYEPSGNEGCSEIYRPTGDNWHDVSAISVIV